MDPPVCQILSFLFLAIQLESKFHFLLLELSFGPSPEPVGEATPLPIKDGFPQETSLLILLIDNIKPLVEASSLLSLIHSDNEVAHDAVSLGLHF